MGMNVTLGLFE